MNRIIFITIFIIPFNTGFAQHRDSVVAGTLPPGKADSSYIRTYTLKNDFRIAYGADGANLTFGSIRDGERIKTSLFDNVSDLVGFGITYKILDTDIMFTLPQTRIMKEDRENLQQYRLALSYTGRKLSMRGYISETRGLISTDGNSDFFTNPDVRLFKLGAQLTYNFNSSRYSYRASNFQNELQTKTASAFLFRFEPFYKKLQAPTGVVPSARDLPATYGTQTGFEQVDALGLLFMPGYGINVVVGKEEFFFSPLLLAGPGIAFNTLQVASGKNTSYNFEWTGTGILNTGYNGPRTYLTLRVAYDISYTRFNPVYYSSSNLRMTITAGYRFRNLERFIPTGL